MGVNKISTHLIGVLMKILKRLKINDRKYFIDRSSLDRVWCEK